MPAIPKELLDQFVIGPITAESVEAALRQFKKAIIERALSAGMTHHLGYESGDTKPEGVTNHRNGSSGMSVRKVQAHLREMYAVDVSADLNGRAA